jgi:hypothetical protein
MTLESSATSTLSLKPCMDHPRLGREHALTMRHERLTFDQSLPRAWPVRRQG